MSKQIKVTEFEGIDHGIDNPSYFQGCGTAFTSFEHVQTGTADNPREALEDCLEMIAQGEHNIDTDDLKRRILEEYNEGKDFPEKPSAHDDLMDANFPTTPEPEEDDFETAEEWEAACEEWEEKQEQEKEEFNDGCESNYYHYSIRYNI